MQWLLSSQFHLKKTWESLFQTLEGEETVLVFDNYSNNQEFFLKHQEKKIESLTDGTIRVYM